MRLTLLTLLLLAAAAPARAAAPVYKWFQSSEFYFSAPFSQSIHYPANNKTAQADAWAFGFRAAGNGEGVQKTAALQAQKLTVSNSALGVNSSFYIFDLLAGAEYITPRRENKPLRFTAAALVDLGLSDPTFFMAPMLMAGLLYQPNPEQVPGGLSLSFYYRFTSVSLDNAGGPPGALRPALGLKIGYIFEGFWAPK